MKKTNNRRISFAMMLLALITLFTFMDLSGFSQTQFVHTNPFKKMPKYEALSFKNPAMGASLLGATGKTAEIASWRFTGPMAGTQYLFSSNTFQVVTGAGYGYSKMHVVNDTTNTYYTDFSANFVVFAGGNATPSLYPNNVISVGFTLGFLNQTVMFGPTYNLPRNGTKGSMGVDFNISVPL